MAKIDQNGLVTFTNIDGYSEGEVLEINGQPEQSSMSFGSIVAKLMAFASAALQLVVDTASRRVHVDESAANGALATAAANGEKIVLTPVAGQTGRSLAWEVTSGSAGLATALAVAAKGVVDPVRPSMSVESLLSKLVSAAPEGVKPVVHIDQATGVVNLYAPADGAAVTAALNGAAKTGTHKGYLDITEPTVAGEPAPLKFEGGAF